MGVLFGVPAGLLEEIGWTGFAFPRKSSRHNPLGASILLGLLWSLWHLPVVNYLGTATPHGAYWFPFFLVFAFAMTAMRVLISWAFFLLRVTAVVSAYAWYLPSGDSSTNVRLLSGPTSLPDTLS
jgi:membrane protease YdiL (CAAX protease family)